MSSAESTFPSAALSSALSVAAPVARPKSHPSKSPHPHSSPSPDPRSPDHRSDGPHDDRDELANPLAADQANGEQAKETAEAFRAEKARRLSKGYDWAVIFWIALIHVAAVAAPFYFSWEGIALAIVLGWLTGGIGICLGYHRLLTHQSFRTYKPVRWLIAGLGGLAGQGSAVHWVANHRKHHAHSDQPGDPHSPHDGGWWSHVLWLSPKTPGREYDDYNRRWAPDMMKDKMLVFLDRTFLVWNIGLGVALYFLGNLYGGTYYAWSFLTWGMFFRLTYVLHSTWLVNSATHMWGYRNYKTTDDSRNLWWVALMTYGEGWHNNHHAYPRMAAHGHRWWEVDSTFMAIKAMEKVGLAWDVVDSRHRRRHDENSVVDQGHE